MLLFSPEAIRPSAEGRFILTILLILSEITFDIAWFLFLIIFLDPGKISAKEISQGRQDLLDLEDLFFRLWRYDFRPKAALS